MYFDKILTNDPLIAVADDPRYKYTWELYKRLERSLYPWIYPYWQNVFHINNQTLNADGSSNRGIVICVGNSQFKFAASTIRAIREIFHCDLPIEIFYINDNDLSEAKRSYFQNEFSHVTLRKLEDYIGRYYTRFGGWAMKPFAMLASQFTELIMMDADVYFLQNPSILFNDTGYQTAGSLFFYDRTLFPNWEKGPNWLRSFLPTMSSLVPNTRWFKGLSSHEQESGIVVIDKRKSLLGLLSTCKLNGLTERDEVVYKHVHGDKETFWIGYEIMQTPYAFIRSFGAVIGGMGRGGNDGERYQVCGVQLHLDANKKPLWFNGGLYRNKHAHTLEYLNFTHFAEGDNWEFATHCIRDTDKIQEIDPEQRRVALTTVEFDKKRAKDEELLNQGKWRPKDYSTHN
ncbi:mannosyltransferase putative-domain-containing protein [Cokeromyces recurvatus]|uniref:mannosyltransferase putative-domain-containing protein n=1 Tax=Cokeromyces recurvatus TaxID=90255 RepID=UPI0022204E54|nr:mannosyltransferase putative-domain-containing protein [Cokeromyces recurvatus]KAI7907770.1 mannosyltransferase putative-domain-containing protein [Cokeromyces recurvatus]